MIAPVGPDVPTKMMAGLPSMVLSKPVDDSVYCSRIIASSEEATIIE